MSPRPPSELLTEIAAPGSLVTAWEHVRRRGAGPGIDGVTVERYALEAPGQLLALHQRLRAGEYRPRPGRSVKLAKDPKRPIVVATVEDRIVQRAAASALSRRYEPVFADSAWAYRPGRSVDQAVRCAVDHLAAGRRFFVRTDVTKFFDRIDRARLGATLTEDGVPRDVVRLVERLLRAGVVHGARVSDGGVGTPQGSALSPVLSNVYLRPVDATMEAGGHAYLRYADDILVLGESDDAVAEALRLLREQVEALGLSLSERKTQRGHAGGGLVYLGMVFDAAGARLSFAALRALEEATAEAVAEPDALAAVGTEWARWYGSLAAADARTWPVVAALALVRAEDGDMAKLERLAEVRLAVREPDDAAAAVATRVALVSAWSSLGEAGHRAALLDALAAARHPLGEAERATLARALAIPERSVGVLSRGLAAVVSDLGAEGCLSVVAAARGLLALERSRDALAREGDAQPEELLDVDAAAEALAASFRGREGEHVRERRNGRGQLTMWRMDKPLGEAQIRAHLAGEARAGVYLVRADGAVHVAAVTVHIKRESMLPPWIQGASTGEARALWERLHAMVHDHAVAVLRAARRLGLGALLEDTGGASRRVWLPLSGPVRLAHARALLVRVLDEAGDAAEELSRAMAPGIDRLTRAPGPAVYLPLGVHPRAGRRSRFVDEAGRPLATVEALQAVARSTPDQVWQLVRPETRALGAGGFDRQAGLQIGALGELPSAQRVLAGCGVLAALASKAARLGHLEGAEKASLYEALGFLPETERVLALHALLAATGSQQSEVRRRLSKSFEVPVSCARLRQRHAGVAVEVGCDCVFRGLWGGVYPTPVLHAMEPRELAPFRERMAETKRQRKECWGDAPRAPKQRAPAPVALPASPPTSEAPRPEFEAALGRLQKLRRAVDDATRGLRRTEQELDELFRRAGVDRVRVERGWLLRVPGDRPKFLLEL